MNDWTDMHRWGGCCAPARKYSKDDQNESKRDLHTRNCSIIKPDKLKLILIINFVDNQPANAAILIKRFVPELGLSALIVIIKTLYPDSAPESFLKIRSIQTVNADAFTPA